MCSDSTKVRKIISLRMMSDVIDLKRRLCIEFFLFYAYLCVWFFCALFRAFSFTVDPAMIIPTGGLFLEPQKED